MKYRNRNLELKRHNTRVAAFQNIIEFIAITGFLYILAMTIYIMG